MTLIEYFVIGYFAVGFLLSYIWWKEEYKPYYEIMKENGEQIEEPMAVLILLFLVIFWPIKAIINKFY